MSAYVDVDVHWISALGLQVSLTGNV